MEILLVYLYGIYDSIAGFLTFATIILTSMTITFSLVKAVTMHERNRYSHTQDKYEQYTEGVKFWDKFIYIKLSILLIIINILVPPKNIAVAMVAAPYAVQAAADLVDSNTTKKISTIIDLSLDKAITKLKDQ